MEELEKDLNKICKKSLLIYNKDIDLLIDELNKYKNLLNSGEFNLQQLAPQILKDLQNTNKNIHKKNKEYSHLLNKFGKNIDKVTCFRYILIYPYRLSIKIKNLPIKNGM